MEYFIETLELKEAASGKSYKSVTLNGGGETYEKVSLWPETEGYESFIEGGKIVGEVYKKGNYWNFKPANAKPAYKGGGAITKAMEKKNDNIVAAQERKHDAIRLAGAQRDAVLMVTTFEANTPFPADNELKSKIEAWVRYFLGLQDQPFI